MKSSKPAFKNSIPAGTYEVIIDACGETTNPIDGRNGIKFDFCIRPDIEQSCKGRHIYKSFYEDENGELPEKKIGEFANACGVADGEDYEPWQLRLRTCQIVVKQFSPDDKPNEKISYVAFARKSKEEPIEREEEPAFEDINEEDIPFK